MVLNEDVKRQHGVNYSKVGQKKRTGYVGDQDVMRLLSIKEKVFPVFNYQRLIQQ